LVDVKKADIETFDRGHFTPLLNAAWEGDRTLVRFFLQKGADRSVRGTQHYSKAIAPSGFEGMTADQWADQRGHPDVAKLIRLGL
jgi:ankyrin repeat protein